MTTLFSQSPDPDPSRTSRIILSGCVGILTNLALFGLKFTLGFLSRSVAVTTDAFNNLSDAASSIISIIGARMANKPADTDHPFGHGRIEYIAALIVSFLIMNVGISFFRTSLEKIRSPRPLGVSSLTLGLLILSILVKLFLFLFNRKLAKNTGAAVLQATALDSLSDAGITAVTVLSLFVYRFSRLNIDGFVSLFVSLAVIWAAVGIIRDTLTPLIGEKIDPGQYTRVQQIISEMDGVISTHDLVLHNYGPGRAMASVHIEVDRTMDLEAAHSVADAAEREVHRQTGIFMVAHIDPVELQDKKVLQLRQQIGRILSLLDPALDFHDFHVSRSDGLTYIHFDLLVPFSYSPDQEERLVGQVSGFIREIDPKYRCEILVDKGFISENSR